MLCPDSASGIRDFAELVVDLLDKLDARGLAQLSAAPRYARALGAGQLFRDGNPVSPHVTRKGATPPQFAVLTINASKHSSSMAARFFSSNADEVQTGTAQSLKSRSTPMWLNWSSMDSRATVFVLISFMSTMMFEKDATIISAGTQNSKKRIEAFEPGYRQLMVETELIGKAVRDIARDLVAAGDCVQRGGRPILPHDHAYHGWEV